MSAPGQPAPSTTLTLTARQRWLVLGVAGAALMMTAIDQTIVATALPNIQHQLHARLNIVGWTITIYALGCATTYPVIGRVVDRVGSRLVFLVAITVFAIASVCCGMSTNIYELIAFRALQAIGGAAVMPSSTKIVALTFGTSRDRALGSFIAIFSVGSVSGPIIGGLLIDYGSWRDIFFVNIPIAVALFAAAWFVLPATPIGPRRPFDIRGLWLLALAVLAAMFGVAHLGEPGAQLWDPLTIGPFLIAAVAVPTLTRHIRRVPEPFVPPQMLFGRDFRTMNFLNLVYGASTSGFGALVPLYAITRFHIAYLAAGTLLTARAVGSIVVGAAAVALLRRTGYRKPIVVGLLIIAVGQAGIALCPSACVAYVWLSVAAGLSGIGMGAANPAVNNACLHLMPDDTASVAALRAMFRQIGAISAVSLATAIAAPSSDPGRAQAFVFMAFAVSLLALIPLVRRVPEHRGAW